MLCYKQMHKIDIESNENELLSSVHSRQDFKVSHPPFPVDLILSEDDCDIANPYPTSLGMTGGSISSRHNGTHEFVPNLIAQ